MSDTIEAEIELKTSSGETVRLAPGDLQEYLEKGIVLDSLATSIKVSRSIPRDKFEKNEYFHSVSTNLSGAYALAGNMIDNDHVRKALGSAIVSRARKAFNLSRVLIREQQENDGLTVVSLGDVTKMDSK